MVTQDIDLHATSHTKLEIKAAANQAGGDISIPLTNPNGIPWRYSGCNWSMKKRNKLIDPRGTSPFFTIQRTSTKMTKMGGNC